VDTRTDRFKSDVEKLQQIVAGTGKSEMACAKSSTTWENQKTIVLSNVRTAISGK
jgi:hypothetical protein